MTCFIKLSFILLFLFEGFLNIEAYHGSHPDAEVIEDTGVPTYRERNILEVAVRRGMDPNSVLTLLRTRQPVIKKETLPNGSTKSTIYTLQPDGSISAKTRIEFRLRKNYFPINNNTPMVGQSGQVIPINNPFDFPMDSILPESRPRVQTFVGPNGERGVIRTWSSGPQPIPDNGRHLDKTPEVNYEFTSEPWRPETEEETPIPEEEDSEWKAAFGEDSIEENTTPKHTPQITPKTWTWPEFIHTTTKQDTSPSTTTTTTSKPPIHTELEKPNDLEYTTTFLPTLDEFLKQQYGSKTQSATTTATTTNNPKVKTTSPTTSKYPENTTTSTTYTTTPSSEAEEKTPKPLKHVDIDDLPITNILNSNGQPIAEDHLGEKPHTTENIPKTSINDLDPSTLNDLKAMGINTDLLNVLALGKTEKEQVGRPLSTMYKIYSPLPIAPVNKYPSLPELSPKTTVPLHVPIPIVNPIEAFLQKFGLTKTQLLEGNGRYAESLIDDEGCVLTVTFVLSRPMVGQTSPHNEHHTTKQRNEPIK